MGSDNEDRPSSRFLLKGSRVIDIVGEVTRESSRAIADRLWTLQSVSRSPIVLVIDSRGGSGDGARLVGSALKLCTAPTVGLVATRAYSAAFMMLQACRSRLALRSSRVGTHFSYVLSNQELRQPSHAIAYDGLMRTRQALQADVWEQEIAALAKRSGLTEQAVRVVLQESRILSAMEALDRGFIDEIVT